MYVDIDLSHLKRNDGRVPIIHGIDDKTDYADISFGKVGEPLPESDEEDKKDDASGGVNKN